MEKKRKFLIVSLSGLVGDIAWRVLKEGHEARQLSGPGTLQNDRRRVAATRKLARCIRPKA